MLVSTHGIIAQSVSGTPPFSNTKSILLDGVDDFVDCGQVTQIQNTNALSVSCWFNYNSINTSADGLVAKDDNSRINGNWYIALQSNQVRFLLKTANGQDALNSTTVSSGTWYHTLCVWNGSTMRIYINGTLSNSISVSNATGTLGAALPQDTVKIGLRLPTSGFYDGNIDEVAVWNSDQSANINSIYSASGAVDLSSLSPLSWWRFEGTGTTATDSGSGGNNGTLTNGVTRSTDVP
jgi:hypothetical protein